jgi:hypothetical protein
VEGTKFYGGLHDIIYKDEPCRARRPAVGQEWEDERRHPNTRRKERDLGSNQAPIRERLGGEEGV